jgi:hypothetical protein
MGARYDAIDADGDLTVTMLPISGAELTLRELSGAEELMLLGGGSSVPLVVRHLLAALSGATVDDLPVGDAESLLLALRATVAGEAIRAELTCPNGGCRARIDLSFSTAGYLRHRRPRQVRTLAASGEWLRETNGGDAAFRIPTLRDQVEVCGHREPAAELARRCMLGEPSPRTRKRIERLLDAIAPTLSDYVEGRCPDCGTAVEVYFDVEQFVLRELREAAADVIDDVHLLASQYGWSESDIVALPRSRRSAYAERARSAGAA